MAKKLQLKEPKLPKLKQPTLEEIDARYNATEEEIAIAKSEEQPPVKDPDAPKRTRDPKLYDKYRHYVNQVKSGYVRGVKYEEAIEVLRYVEKRVGHSIPLNFSCNTCVFDLFKLFTNIENN